MELLELLMSETKIESLQRESREFIPDFKEIDNVNVQTPKLRSHFFFKNKEIYISKHNRYAPYPEHSHEFIEFNYQLSGHSNQVINGENYILSEGDLLLMDTDSTHSIGTLGKNDILLNILFSNRGISLDSLRQMQITDSILYKILLTTNTLSNKADNFLIYREKDNKHIKDIILQMTREYFFSKPFSSSIISNYLQILLYELARLYPIEHEINEEEINSPFVEVLEIIDKEYDTITLSEVADRLNYNKNYLSNLIKKQSSFTFTELLNEKRLMKAQMLGKSTEMPINDIASKVGYSNKSYFYTKYKEYFGHLPNEDRERSKN